MAKICFEGFYPRQGETRIWFGGNEPATLPAWRDVRVLTRGEGLALHQQRGRLWVTRDGAWAGCRHNMFRCPFPALPHPDGINLDSPFAWRAEETPWRP